MKSVVPQAQSLGSAGAPPAVSRAPRDTSARGRLFAEAPKSAGEGARAPRILMTADTVGGVWTYAVELIRALPQVQFALATMGGEPEPLDLPNVQVFPSCYALEWMDEPWEEVDRAGDWLQEIARDFAPDLVHLNGYAHATLPWNVPTVVVAHSCVFSWWKAVKGEEPPAAYAEYHRRVSAGLAAADLVLAPTAAMLDSLGENYGFSGNGRVIFNARDPRLFSPGTKRNVIFAAGRLWDEAKNLAALEAVAPHIPWPIEVAGDRTRGGTSFCSSVDGSTDAQKRVPPVRYLGRLRPEALRAMFAAAAIYAFPARYEPFGLSLLEAALSGCALVLGDIPTLREVWGDAAVFVPPNDHAALATVLNELINDPSRREMLAQRALLRAAEFSPERMADAYLAAYATCLPSHSAEAVA
jgi:glycosyltransferase involved in cell wall biosynthesis